MTKKSTPWLLGSQPDLVLQCNCPSGYGCQRQALQCQLSRPPPCASWLEWSPGSTIDFIYSMGHMSQWNHTSRVCFCQWPVCAVSVPRSWFKFFKCNVHSIAFNSLSGGLRLVSWHADERFDHLLVLAASSVSSMFPLLIRLVKKACGKVLQSHIIMVKVVRGMWIGRYEALGLLFDLVLDGDLWILVVILVHLQGGIGHHSRQWVPGGFPEGSVRRCQRTGPQWQAIWVPWKDYWNRKPQWLFCKEPLPYYTVALICIFLIILNIFSHAYLPFLYP